MTPEMRTALADEIAAYEKHTQDVEHSDWDVVWNLLERAEKALRSAPTPPVRVRRKFSDPTTTLVPTIPLGAIEWVDSSEPGDRSRLLCIIRIGGQFMHLEAYEAIEDADGTQQFRGSYGEIADEIYHSVGSDGPWYTVEIEGRKYVLIATPHC
jgi:hypothetical protein